MTNTLIVITGATASGKTSLALDCAEQLGCDIISADSRQIYRGIPIGTACPTPAERARVPHHMVEMLPLDAYYSASQYESDVLALLPRLWDKSPYAVLCGGSMMYVDALTDGIDDLPTIPEATRIHVASIQAAGGNEALMAMLEMLDPDYARVVDRANSKRVAHAVEICMAAGRPYTELRRGLRRERPFRIIKVAIDMPRAMLFDRINRRVDAMMAAGLLDEVQAHLPERHLNSLNTVGYKELFAYLDGTMPLDRAIARIAKNTRVYAKKQLTWLGRPTVRPVVWLRHDTALSDLMRLIRN